MMLVNCDLTLLVIFDRSGSMGDGWDLRNNWQAASDDDRRHGLISHFGAAAK
jgi:hypothetical protein